jgi:hypothetical protein
MCRPEETVGLHVSPRYRTWAIFVLDQNSRQVKTVIELHELITLSLQKHVALTEMAKQTPNGCIRR